MQKIISFDLVVIIIENDSLRICHEVKIKN